MQFQFIPLFLCLSMCHGRNVLQEGLSEEFRISRGRSGAVWPQERFRNNAYDVLGQNIPTEERSDRQLLNLLSDLLSASWALESAQAQRRPQYNSRPSLFASQATPQRNTNDGCYEEACEGNSCQCCNCITCWAC